MNRKDIIKIAESAFTDSSYTDREVVRFAKLIVQHEREEIAKMIEEMDEYGFPNLANMIRARK